MRLTNLWPAATSSRCFSSTAPRHLVEAKAAIKARKTGTDRRSLRVFINTPAEDLRSNEFIRYYVGCLLLRSQNAERLFDHHVPARQSADRHHQRRRHDHAEQVDRRDEMPIDFQGMLADRPRQRNRG